MTGSKSGHTSFKLFCSLALPGTVPLGDPNMLDKPKLGRETQRGWSRRASAFTITQLLWSFNCQPSGRPQKISLAGVCRNPVLPGPTAQATLETASKIAHEKGSPPSRLKLVKPTLAAPEAVVNLVFESTPKSHGSHVQAAEVSGGGGRPWPTGLYEAFRDSFPGTSIAVRTLG